MFRLSNVLAAFALTLGVAGAAEAASYSFSTAQSQFDPGVNNQGWWNANNISNPNSTNNGNVYTGGFGLSTEHRSFFTFDLSGLDLSANEEIVSVTFSGNAGGVRVYNGDFETFGLFDVTTSATVVNEHLGTTNGVFADLGSGNTYGSRNFFEAEENSDFEIGLNSQAFADILAAQGKFFSIGGALLTMDNDGLELVFGSTNRNPYTLDIETRISAVPLPAAFPLYGAGLAVLGFLGWRKRKQAAA